MSETQNISGCFPLRPTTTSQLGHVWIKSLKSSKHSETMQQGIQPAKKSKIKIMNIINTPGPRIIRFLGLEKSLINTSFLTRICPQNGISIQKYYFGPKNDGEKGLEKIILKSLHVGR